MPFVEAPQSFVTREECDKLAFQNGFRRSHGETDGWRRYGSTTAQGSIWLAYDTGGTWILALDHPGVIAELDLAPETIVGPGIARFRFTDLGALYDIIPRIYDLGTALPDAPLQDFLYQTANLPSSTEAERMVIQRVGQNIFRERLITYWSGRCPLTGITDLELLRASHIKPWKLCESDAERLDVHNGLLLSALWDAAFDRFLVSFNDDGSPIFSPALSEPAISALKKGMTNEKIALVNQHREKLQWHRKALFEHQD